MQRIGSGVARFTAGTQSFPITIRDVGMDAARRRADRATVLLRARDPVWKTIVSRDVIDLRSRLVVPRAPRRSAVDTHDRSLIAREDHSFRIVGINPELVIMSPPGAPLMGVQVFPASVDRYIDVFIT